MIPFAVRHSQTPQGEGSWVLAVEGDRFLLTDNDGHFYWHDMADCTLVKAATPDVPRMVLPVSPPQQQGSQVIVPGVMENRAFRRNGNN